MGIEQTADTDSNLATIGAAVILLSLPLDGFFQRIVSYSTRPMLDTSIATISRAVIYDPLPQGMTVNGSQKLTFDTQLDSFTYPFIQGMGILPGIDFNCPTGNCVYDPFYSLALDFQCQEIPHILEFGCYEASAEWMTTVDYRDIKSNSKAMPNVSSCGHFLDVPNYGKQLMSGYELKPDGSIGEILSTRFFPVMDVWTNEQYWNGSYSFQPANGLSVADFILASTPGSFDGAAQNNTPVVTECEIHWAVKRIRATVSGGQLLEEALETIEFKSDLESPWDPIDGSEYVTNFSKILPDTLSPGGTAVFGVDNTTAFQVWLTWASYAPSTLNLPAQRDIGPVQKAYWAVSSGVDFMVRNHHSGGPVLPWDAPNNVTKHMADTVLVQNQLIRNNFLSQRGQEGKDVAFGHAYKEVQLVHVEWPWISMPLCLLVISGLFLAATVVRTSRDKVGVYKTSALASLFSDVGDHNKVEPCEPRRGQLNARAKILRGSRLIVPGTRTNPIDEEKAVLAT
jgi:hypothetical protein